jgi:hypothetical protein
MLGPRMTGVVHGIAHVLEAAFRPRQLRFQMDRPDGHTSFARGTPLGCCVRYGEALLLAKTRGVDPFARVGFLNKLVMSRDKTAPNFQQVSDITR